MKYPICPLPLQSKQSKAGQNNRSTVGTMTELDDLVRTVFSHIAEIHCCGQVVRKESNKTISDQIYKQWPGQQVMLMASMEPWSKLKAAELKAQLSAQGFTRAWVDGEVVRIEDSTAKALKTGYVIVDRIKAQESNFHRCLESCALTLKLGRGRMFVHGGGDEGLKSFSNRLECEICGTQYTEPSPSLFNFNHPLGACDSCQGFGRVAVLDHNKIIPDEESSLADQG